MVSGSGQRREASPAPRALRSVRGLLPGRCASQAIAPLLAVLGMVLSVTAPGCALFAPQTVGGTRVGARTVAPTPAATRQPVSTAAPALAIESFTADAVALGDGRRRVTFAWRTRGASSVAISLRTRYRFAPFWGHLAPNGTQIYEGETLYPNPRALLTARDLEGNTVQEPLTLDWPCRYPYFFTAEAEVDCPLAPHGLCTCPRHPAVITQAVEQLFENGRMIWFQGTDDEPSYPDKILVLFDDAVHEGEPDFHEAAFFEDTRTPGQPDRDPDLTPPLRLLRPARRFGTLWRRKTSVRERVGWATAPEQAFEGAWQRLATESLGGSVLFITADGRLVFFTGWWMAGGSWTFVR